MRPLVALLIFAAPLTAADRTETPDEAKQRHERVAQRRAGTDIICHRGASEFAKENTLEAYRATVELGGHRLPVPRRDRPPLPWRGSRDPRGPGARAPLTDGVAIATGGVFRNPVHAEQGG